MGELLTPTHIIVVAVVAFVVFGGRRLPDLAKAYAEASMEANCGFVTPLLGPQIITDQVI
jgi:mttA/Hcf106 family